jgi:hypothetical protein
MSPRRARRLPDAVPRRGRGAGTSSRSVRPSTESGVGSGAGLPIGPERHELGPDGDWVVRLIAGGASAKSYRCPGCDQEIPPGTAHLVAWPALVPGPSERRHWHRPCWEQRMRRRPGRRGGS